MILYIEQLNYAWQTNCYIREKQGTLETNFNFLYCAWQLMVKACSATKLQAKIFLCDVIFIGFLLSNTATVALKNEKNLQQEKTLLFF